MNIRVPIIYEDSDILVFDKPSGLVVNISNTSGSETLQSILIHEYGLPFEPKSPKLIKDSEDVEEFDEFKSRSGLVHRLDKQTSGVVIVAKTEPVFRNLQKQFKDRLVEKEYTALVLGHLDHDLVEIDAPIKRNPDYRMKMIMAKDGKSALTKVKLIKNIIVNDEKYALVNVYPKTGRTHQIRVHLAGMNHPVVSDEIYMTKKLYEKFFQIFPRLMLHATQITLTHPTKGEVITFTSEVPEVFPKF